MTTSEFEEPVLLHDAFIDQMLKNYAKGMDIVRKKNRDYAGDQKKDPLKNFRLVAFITNDRLTIEDGMLVRLCDKIQRVANLTVQDAAVADETIEDTMIDAMNYFNIWLTYRHLRHKGLTL